jgi:hypothetical protein
MSAGLVLQIEEIAKGGFYVRHLWAGERSHFSEQGVVIPGRIQGQVQIAHHLSLNRPV